MIYAFYRFVSVIPTKSRCGFTNGQTKTKKGRASLRSPSILNQCNMKKLLTVKCVSLCRCRQAGGYQCPVAVELE